MRLFDKLYKVRSGDVVDEKFLNARFGSLDERQHAQEVLKVSVEDELERIRQIAVTEITVILQDAAAVIEGISQLATITTLHSQSALTIATGSHQLVIDPDERDQVPQNAFVTLTPIANRSFRMGGYLSAYDAASGTVEIDVTQVDGDGSFGQWLIGLASPSAGNGLAAGNVQLDEISGLEAENVQDALSAISARVSDAEALAFAGL